MTAGQPFDAQALAGWLAARIDGFQGPLAVEKFPGGQSNPTFRLDTPSGRYVLRCKPGPKASLLPSAHAIEREYRVLKALAATEVPVPEVFVLCEDEDVIGRAFYLMSHVDGRCFGDNALPGLSPAERTAIYRETSRVIASLHAMDPMALGLGDYGSREGYFQRQIARWTKQYRLTETDPIPAMEALMAWLPGHVPADADKCVSLVHGDLKLDNMIFHPDEPRILAVLDWELSTLGHSLADLAYRCLMWHIQPGLLHGLAGSDLDALGIPTEATYLRWYGEHAGHAIGEDWRYYLAYNAFRLAGIFQGIGKRALEGSASHARAADYGRMAPVMAELGWKLALA